MAPTLNLFGTTSTQWSNIESSVSEPKIPGFYRESELDSLVQQQWVYDQEGIQIPAQGLTLLVGPSGIGKSYLALHLALRIAQKETVVYVAAEKSQLLNGRTKAWYQYHQVASQDKVRFSNRPISLLDSWEVNQFVENCRHFKPAVLIIDTLARCMVGGDENSTKDMTIVVDHCDTIMRQLGCSLILVHHTGKDPNKGPRGANALQSASDCEIRLSGKGKVITLKNIKQSGAEEFKDVKLRFLPVEVISESAAHEPHNDQVLVPVEHVTAPELTNVLTSNQLKVLNALAQNLEGLTFTKLLEITGLNKSSFTGASGALKGRKLIQHEDQGLYLITEPGNAALAGLGH